MKQYLTLLQHILDKGMYKSPARENMPGTTSVFGYQMRFNLQEGFPLLTTKKMYWKGIVIELLWFLRGDTNIKFLLDNGVNIWNEDAYNYYKKLCKDQYHMQKKPVDFKDFLLIVKGEEKYSDTISKEFIPENYKWGDCGYQYGKVWRKWEGKPYCVNFDFLIDCQKEDQIANVIKSLKENPEGRRHIVTAWDPSHDQDLALTWCHAMFQFNCRKLNLNQRKDIANKNNSLPDGGFTDTQWLEILKDKNIPEFYLDCQLYQRSADVVLGVPFNIASYALLTEIIAKICNMIPGEFIHTFGDVHIYDNHMDAVKEQLYRKPMELPKLKINDRIHVFNIEELLNLQLSINDFQLENYNPHPKLESETELSTGLKK